MKSQSEDKVDKSSPEVAPESGDKLANIDDSEEAKAYDATFPPENERGSEAAGEDFE